MMIDKQQKTTLLAWQPWQDAFDAIKFLEEMDSPGSDQNWRVYWVASITLLRTVGHVLHLEDQKRIGNKGKLLEAWWKQNQNDLIFKEFIKGERDAILKHYKLGALPLAVRMRPFLGSEEPGIRGPISEERTILVWGEDGEDSIEMLYRALVWWDKELRILEEAIADSSETLNITDSRVRHRLLEESLAKRDWNQSYPRWI